MRDRANARKKDIDKRMSEKSKCEIERQKARSG